MSTNFWQRNALYWRQISSLRLLQGVTKRNGLLFFEILQVKYQRGAEPLYEGA